MPTKLRNIAKAFAIAATTAVTLTACTFMPPAIPDRQTPEPTLAPTQTAVPTSAPTPSATAEAQDIETPVSGEQACTDLFIEMYDLNPNDAIPNIAGWEGISFPGEEVNAFCQVTFLNLSEMMDGNGTYEATYVLLAPAPEEANLVVEEWATSNDLDLTVAKGESPSPRHEGTWALEWDSETAHAESPEEGAIYGQQVDLMRPSMEANQAAVTLFRERTGINLQPTDRVVINQFGWLQDSIAGR